MTYIGRFAPTPSGPLHFGSLVAALASYLDAKSHNGKWLLRIEDLDPPREDPSASTIIPEQLSAHGLTWDGEIQYQSKHGARYESVLEQLKQTGRLFSCSCSRKALITSGGLHHGKCSDAHLNTQQDSPSNPFSLRFLVDNISISFTDRVFGIYQQDLAEVGDQILKRKDGLYAYQLAVLVDDFDSKVTHVVRGLDLMDNTPRQIHLLEQLEWPIPSYLHIPLITNNQGQKLSKQNKATPLNLARPVDNLLDALIFLQQTPPPKSQQQTLASLLAWATKHWCVDAIPSHKAGLITP